ncbi:putative oxidoreductase TDA3 [Capsicum galapagoense]
MLLLTPSLPFPSISVPTKFLHLKSSSLFLIRSSSMDTPQPKKAAVCGGGVIGVCTAYFLSKNGAAVTLIEQSSIACAASGRAGGFLALDWCDGGPVASLARASFNLHCSLAEELNGPQSYGYRPLTTLSVSVSESSLSSSSSASNQTGPGPLPSWVDGPAKSPRTIGSTSSTAQVHPQLFTKTLLSKAVNEYGVEVVIGKAERVELAEGKTRGVVLEDGREIVADAVLLALGPWTKRFSLLGSIFTIYGIKAHSIVLKPKEPDRITPHALFLTYYPAQGGKPMDPEVYPRPTGEVYICGMSARAEVPDDPEQITPVPESINALKRVAASVSSHLVEGEAAVKTEQACILPCSEDDVPIIGEVPGIKGCYVATGHSCWGILNGPATGAAMAELILDGHASIVDLSRFNPTRFSSARKK